MEILTDYNDLVDKKIVFAHMAQFAEQITIATEDGSVLMVDMAYEDDECQEVNVYAEHRVLGVLKSDRGKWMRDELSKLGIFDLEQYRKEQEELRIMQQEERKKQQDERDYKRYLELNERFGGIVG